MAKEICFNISVEDLIKLLEKARDPYQLVHFVVEDDIVETSCTDRDPEIDRFKVPQLKVVR